MDYSLFLLVIYLIEIVLISFILYYLFRKKMCRIYITIPLYSIVIASSLVTPFYLDLVYGLLINYFILVSIFSIYYVYFRDTYFLVYGFTYLLLYFYACTIPYVFTNCPVYSLSCLYMKVFSINIMNYIIFTIGLFIVILLNTILSEYSKFEYILFHLITIIHSISHYIVLLKPIPIFLYSIVAIAITAFIYFASKYIGYIIYVEEESVEIIFDKYVSINASTIFTVLALSLLYSTFWG